MSPLYLVCIAVVRIFNKHDNHILLSHFYEMCRVNTVGFGGDLHDSWRLQGASENIRHPPK